MPRPHNHGRLLNLLYKKTVPEIRPKVPIVRRLLYEQEPEGSGARSVLDDLMHAQWQQQPLDAAVAAVHAAAPGAPRSAVLRLRCNNAYVGRTDLHDIYPVVRDRSYFLGGELRKGLRFHVVKARNPYSLMFTGHFYLVFANHAQACAYLLETAGKVLNGVPVSLDFVAPQEPHLQQMASPALAPGFRAPPRFLHSCETFRSAAAAAVFAGSQPHTELLAELARARTDRSHYTGAAADPLSAVLARFASVPARYSSVVVRGLPLGVSAPALQSLFCDYAFATEHDPQQSIVPLHANAASQLTMTLLRFRDEQTARAFVRNHHGRRWEKLHTRKVKAMYEPILCEVVD